MLRTNLVQTGSNTAPVQQVSGQISYSTADIERSVFYGEKSSEPQVNPPVKDTRVVVVLGEMFELEEGPIPEQKLRHSERK